MEAHDARVNLFVNQMKGIRGEELTNILRCPLCSGLYRFAHTLIECGHTFCQQCIFAYIRGFKGRNPEVKCPQCHTQVEAKYERSIMKDVFKQSLVDLLEPSYAEEEKLIIARVQLLFPQFNLHFLLEEFNFSTFESSKKRRKEEKTLIMSKLPSTVKQKIGINFEIFTEMILIDHHFQKYQEIVKKYNDQKQTVLDLRPKTQRDFSFVGVKNKMKTANFSISKIRKFLEKKLLIKLQNCEEFSKELINPDSEKLQIRIKLFLNNQELDDEYNLLQIMEEGETLIYYSLT